VAAIQDASKAGPLPKTEWLDRYDRGDFEGALVSATNAGVDRLARTLSASRLWKLQEVARITGRHDLSVQILSVYRERFPSGKNAATAGFLLGRIACDRHGRLGESSRWFETYLSESPRGPLAEEALGRLIIIYEKMDKKSLAKKAATRYLDQYREDGAFERIARSVLDSN
jgi:hypothetical protein